MSIPWAAGLVPMNGGNSGTVLCNPTERLVYKTYRSERSVVRQALRGIKVLGSSTLQQAMPMNAHKDMRRPIDEDLEIAVTKEWRAHHIPTPAIVDKQGDVTVYDLIDGETFDYCLSKDDYQATPFQALITTLSMIRAFAKEKGDYQLLHTDNHLGNYIWSPDSGEAYAFDPLPSRMKREGDFEQVDALLNLQLMYSIMYWSPKHSSQYIEELAASFTPAHRAHLLEQNKPVSPHILNAFNIYARWTHKFTGKQFPHPLTRTYAPENTKRINEIIAGI